MLYGDRRAEVIDVVGSLVDGRLLDCTGGMVAMRCSTEHLLMTTFGAGFRRWRLDCFDFIVCDNDGDVVEAYERLGPASMPLTLQVFKMFPMCNVVLHTHGEYTLAFASLGRSLGEIPCLRADDQLIKEEYLARPYPVRVPTAMPDRPEVVAVNQQLIPQLAEKLGHRRDELAHRGLAFTTFKHGISVLARDLSQAVQTLVEAEHAARDYIHAPV